MSEKLKTLGDISPLTDEIINAGFEPVISIKILKAEAVKWVKFLKEGQKKGHAYIKGFGDLFEDYEYTDLSATEDFITWFFNLTEADLK